MPTTQMLLVLVVRDASFRSALIARLSIAGANLVTAGTVRDPALTRLGDRPAVLIADEASVAGNELAAILEEPRWHRIVVLTDSQLPLPHGADPRLVRLPRDASAARIAELAPGWQPGAED